MAEPADDRDCWWWAGGVGPMTIERGVRFPGADCWYLWRHQKSGPRIFCGSFPNEDTTMVLANVLARVRDTEFVAVLRQLNAKAERHIA